MTAAVAVLLPNEVLVECFAFCTRQEIGKRLEPVCRRFATICQTHFAHKPCAIIERLCIDLEWYKRITYVPPRTFQWDDHIVATEVAVNARNWLRRSTAKRQGAVVTCSTKQKAPFPGIPGATLKGSVDSGLLFRRDASPPQFVRLLSANVHCSRTMTHRKHITKRRHTTLFRTFGPLFSECPSVKLCWYERAFHSSTQLHTFLSEYLLPLFTKCSTFHLNGPHLNAPLDKDGKQFHHWPLLLLPAVLRQNRVIVQLHNGAEQGPTMVCAAEIVQWLHHHDAKANAEAVVRRSRRELFLSFESVGPDDQTGDEQSPILEELKARLVQELYAASEKRPYSLDIILLWCYNRTRGALSEQLNQHTGEKLVCALKVWGGEHGHDLLPGAHDCFTSWSFNITRSPIQA